VISRDYILSHWIKRTWLGHIEESLLDSTIAWSKLASTADIGVEGEEPSGEEPNGDE
jgi:hypothetical protein